MLPKFPTPYYAVIFTSIRANNDPDYMDTNDSMMEMVKGVKGFLGVESSRGLEGLGLTISYWENKEAIDEWRKDIHHKMAKSKGINQWYKSYSLRIAKVESDNFFEKT